MRGNRVVVISVHSLIQIDIPGTQMKLTLSHDKMTRQLVVQGFTSRCETILREALKWAPDSTKSFLKVIFFRPAKSLL